MNNLIFEKHCLTSEECRKIIDYFESNKNLQILGKLQGKDTPEHKESTEISGELTWDNIVNHILIPAINSLTQDYIKTFPYLDMIESWQVDMGYNLQKYNPGQGFRSIHCENGGLNRRMMAWMIYLNTVDDDGGTAFPQQDVILKAEEGKAVIWPAYWTHPHHGVISNTETKYIATGWYSFN